MIKKYSKKLKPFATFCGYILAIYGFLALTTPIIVKLYDKLSLKDAAVIVRPICERFPFSSSMKGTSPSQKGRLIGFQLLAMKNITGVRINISGLNNIVTWGMTSDGMSPTEQNVFLSRLPVGQIESFTTPPLPTLHEETSTTIVAIAMSAEEEICFQEDWLKLSANEGEIYYMDTLHWNIRGFTIFFQITPANLLLLSFILVSLIFIFIKRNSLKKFIKEKTKPQKR